MLLKSGTIFVRCLSLVLLTLCALLMACTRTPGVPMPMVQYPALEKPAAPANVTAGTTKAIGEKRLLVLLHGLGADMQFFNDFGFISAVQKRYPQLEVWVPDAHLGYYRQRSLMIRLQQDLIAKARAGGFQRIDFAGVSLGGFGSLLYLQCCGEDIAKVLLISPFTGDPELHESLAKAESLGNWQPQADANFKDYQVDFWQWIGRNPELLAGGRIWLAYGDDDRLTGHHLLAKQLPPTQVLVLPGKHQDAVFARLWQQLINAGALD